MTAQALSPPPEPRQLSLADLRAVSVLGCGAKGVVFHVVPKDGAADDEDGTVAMALKAVSREAARHKKSGGADGGSASSAT